MSVVDDLRLDATEIGEPTEQVAYIQSLYELSLGHALVHDITLLNNREKFNVCDALTERATDFSNTDMGESPVTPERYSEFLRKEVITNSVNLRSPKYLGHMTAPLPSFVPEMASILAELNQNQVKVETSNVLTLIERQVIGEVHRRAFQCSQRFYDNHLQNPDKCLGVVTGGGTIANITCLSYALNKALGPCSGFEGITKAGLLAALQYHGFSGVAIIGSRRMHYSIEKAAKLMGLGERSVIRVGTNGKGRVDTAAVRKELEQCQQNNLFVLAVIGVAGATETGQVDPLDVLAGIADEFGVHYHVDAAWGGAFVFSQAHRALVKGIERADTITLCSHKQLYTPMGLSCSLFRSPDFARFSENNASYQCKKGSYDLGRFTLEGSRSASVLMLHALINLWGERGITEIFSRTFALTTYLVSCIKDNRAFQLYLNPDLNIVVYRYIPPSLREAIHSDRKLSGEQCSFINSVNSEIQQRQFRNGNTFSSSTALTESSGDVVVFRAVLCNPLASESDIDALLSEQEKLADSILFEHS